MSCPSDNTDIGEDLFNLSILAALAHRLIHAQLHPNIGKIASGLGRRILLATRKWASVRLNQPSQLSAVPPQGLDWGTGDLMNQSYTDHTASTNLPFSFDFSHLGGAFPFADGDFDLGLPDADFMNAFGL